MAHFGNDRRLRVRLLVGSLTQDPGVRPRLMSRTLVFVRLRTDISTVPSDTTVVVLDPTWTPMPSDGPELRPVRQLFERVVERHNLFDESLDLLDDWATAAEAAERFEGGGVTWWFHGRGFLRLGLHEMLAWRYVIEILEADGPFDRIVVPYDREALVAAARATSATVSYGGVVPLQMLVAQRIRSTSAFLVKVRRQVRWAIDPRIARRAALLSRRIDALANEPGAVLALVRAPSFHVIDDGSGPALGDPYVGPVVPYLADGQRPVIRVAIGLDHRRMADWAMIEADPRLIPFSMVERRFPPTDPERGEAAAQAAGIRRLHRIPLLVDGADLGRALTKRVAEQARWFQRQRLAMASAERFLSHLQISAIYTGWESARTSWLGAARRTNVPTVAIQHGVIYHNTPDYRRPAHPALVKPDVTCVFGEYERALLIGEGDYDPEAVVVTGSPRADPATSRLALLPDERAIVRRRLGVADGDRILVVSAARHTVGDEIHSMAMVGRLLDGPLPNVHVVFKLHPEEQERDHYGALLDGLARAGGYPRPRASIIRDIDIYRLLRAADAHLGQYSTVLTDAVLTGTPNMIAVGAAWSDIIGYVDAGVAHPVRSVEDVRAFMAAPRPPTPEARAAFLEAHYRAGDAAARIAEIIGRVAGP